MIASRCWISFGQRRGLQGGGLYGRRPLMWWKRLVVFIVDRNKYPSMSSSHPRYNSSSRLPHTSSGAALRKNHQKMIIMTLSLNKLVKFPFSPKMETTIRFVLLFSVGIKYSLFIWNELSDHYHPLK